MELDRTERRILGSMIEKQWTTPDQYPLTLNSLVLAVNQKSNRDPVMDIQSFEVEGALLALREKGLVHIREREGGRTTRYAERLTENLRLEPPFAAILAELMLRGPQTKNELTRRASRMSKFGSPSEVEAKLVGLREAHLVRLLPRESGRRLPRWTHLLTPETESSAEVQPVLEETRTYAPAEETPLFPPADPVPPPAPAAPVAVEPPVPEEPRRVMEPPVTEEPPPVAAKHAADVEILRDELRALREEVADLWEEIARLKG